MKKRFFYDLFWPLIILILFTILFRITTLDIDIEKIFFSVKHGRFVRSGPFWQFLYYFGNFPGLLLVLCALFFFIAGFWQEKYKLYRKMSVFLILTMLIGPGLIVNSVFKDHWGRPRPRDIKELGGTKNFLYVWQKGPDNTGKSFPCGHCSMGFYLLAPYLFLRNRKKKWALFFLSAGIVWGSMVGLARMVQGGHFASDVLWAGGMVYLTALGLYYLTGLDKNILKKSSEKPDQKHAKYISIITALLGILIIFAVFLATPYSEKKQTIMTRKIKLLDISIDQADLYLKFNKVIRLDWEAYGFGFPGSKIIQNSTQPGQNKLFLTVKKKGIFTELNNVVQLTIPENSLNYCRLKVDKGSLYLNSNDISLDYPLAISIQNGSAYIKIAKQSQFTIILDRTNIINNSSLFLIQEKNIIQCNPIEKKNRIELHLQKGEVIFENE